MAYDKEQVYEDVINAIIMHKIKHFDYIQAYVDPSIETLYQFFPLKSEQSDTIKRLLSDNKINAKTKFV